MYPIPLSSVKIQRQTELRIENRKIPKKEKMTFNNLQQSSSTTPRFVWFMLFSSSDGILYNGTFINYVSLPSSFVIHPRYCQGEII